MIESGQWLVAKTQGPTPKRTCASLRGMLNKWAELGDTGLPCCDDYTTSAVTGGYAPGNLGRVCLHCRCFSNQNIWEFNNRIQEHCRNVRSDHFNLVYQPSPFSRFTCIHQRTCALSKPTTDKGPVRLLARHLLSGRVLVLRQVFTAAGECLPRQRA